MKAKARAKKAGKAGEVDKGKWGGGTLSVILQISMIENKIFNLNMKQGASNHRSIHISANSNFFSCAFINAHVCPVHQCWSYHCSVHFPFDLHVHSPVAQHSRHSLPVLPPALHSVGD